MSQKAEKTVSKELKVVSRPVVSIDDAVRDEKKVSVLGIVRSLGEVSERGLINCLYILKTEKGKDIGYPFQVIGSVVNSREMLEDVRVLLYLGLLEVTEARKLKLTSLGREMLDKLSDKQKEIVEELSKVVEEIKQRVLSEDNLLNILSGSRGRRRR
ncbi:MAG: hypothetical protein RMI56_05030 [Sulfolobales archaeon]|nr:hypothetical protein [Sulfolobales archaeon]MDW8083145.1 hypothetical protein [Sulfolobales archaeon]